MLRTDSLARMVISAHDTASHKGLGIARQSVAEVPSVIGTVDSSIPLRLSATRGLEEGRD